MFPDEDGHWFSIRDGDPRGLAIYLRHYSSLKSRGGHRTVAVGNHARFVGNGEHIVLLTDDCTALFAWRLQQFRKDAQTGVECAVFRNEGEYLSSKLIEEAVGLARARWPGERLFTFVNAAKVRSINPGCCFLKAGWRRAGRSGKGLLVFELLPGMAT